MPGGIQSGSVVEEPERTNDPDLGVMESEVQQVTNARSPILEYATYNMIGIFIPPQPPADMDIPLTTEAGAPLLGEDGRPIILDS